MKSEAFYKKLAKFVIAVCLSIVVVSAFIAAQIGFDYDYEKYFPNDEETIDFFQDYQKNFGSDNDYLLLGMVNQQGVFQKDFLQKVKAIGDSLNKNPKIKLILSPLHNISYVKSAGIRGYVQKPYIDTSWNNLKKDSIRIRNAPKLYGNIFSATAPAVCMFIQTEDQLNKKHSDELLKDLNTWLKDAQFDEYHLSGRIVAQSYYIDKMIMETAIFISSSILLVIIFLLLAFRNFWGVIVPLFTVIFAIIGTVAIMKLTGKSFDLLMVMLPTIIFVVGMSDLVHFLSKYIDELRYGTSKIKAILIAYKEVALATFLTSLTTAIGFFSLITADIVPIREFGIYSGISVFVAYFFAFTLLPAIYVLIPPPLKKNKAANEKRKFTWLLGLNKSFMGVIKYRRAIVSSFVIVIILSVFGASQLKVNNYLLEDLNENDPVRQDFDFFENHFAGVRPFELKLKALNSSNLLDFENAKTIDQLEGYLANDYAEGGVGFSISPLDPIRMAYYIKHNNNIEYFKIPTKASRYNNIKKQISRFGQLGEEQQNYNVVMTKDSVRGRISGKIRDLGGYKMKLANNELNTFIQDSLQNPNLEIKLTGTALLIDENNESLAKQLILGLLLALFMVGIVMALVYKSFKMVMISLIPNVIPLLSIAGVMYVLDFDIKISTTLFFTLAFGIAVDDTIHLLSKLKLEMAKGHGFMYALRRSYVSTGKAIVITSLILCGGFLSLMLSDFTSIYTMGLFVCIALFIAVITDLSILPLVLIKFFKPKAKTVSKKINQ